VGWVTANRRAIRGWPILIAAVGLASVSPAANAWLYPEHRDISLLAVQGLDTEHQAALARLWQDARAGDEARLCGDAADASQGLAPACLDWAALPAIAGDHSCSSRQLLDTARSADWVLGVAAVGAQLKEDLAKIPIVPPHETEKAANIRAEIELRTTNAKHRAARSNVLRMSDVRLQQVDTQLATRATSNAAHFPLARPNSNLDVYAYGQLTLLPGSDMNAVGTFFWYHLSALQKARRLAKEQLTDEQRRALARAALFDEAFALHFLEDMYAAGHVAGSWGDLSQRKGTHDFFNENGLEVFTWQAIAKTFVLMGDANMRPEDAEIAAKAVQTSLEQVLDAATGRSRGYDLPYNAAAPAVADDFDVCHNATIPMRDEAVAYNDGYRPAIVEVLLPTPVPGLGPGFGEVPRFRSEIGTFFGLAAGFDGRAIDGGFLPSQTEHGVTAGLDVSFRVGVGLEGALGDASDGLVFASIGYHSNSYSSNKSATTGLGTLDGSLSSAIPPRSAVSLRFRMPFYIIPGDLVFASPLYLINRDKYLGLAVKATNGGLIPIQVGHATGFGRFQFMAGRELGVTFFGRRRVDQLWVPSGDTVGQVLNYESTAFDLPLFEYRPYRSFSSNQSSSVMLQFFVGADVPKHVSVAHPTGTTAPDLDTVYSLGIRVVFDWRHYR
jgi:hypothetical protein